jgi:hypothetical protein
MNRGKLLRAALVCILLGDTARAESPWPVVEHAGGPIAAESKFVRSFPSVIPVRADMPVDAEVAGEAKHDSILLGVEPLPCPDCVCPRCRCASCLCPEPAAPCDPCPRVNNLNPAWSLHLGGTLSLDMLSNSARPIAPGTPFFLAPQGPFDDDTFDIHARSTSIFFAAKGPRVGEFETGALILFCLYNDSIITDRYGFLPYQAFGELKNETWRFAGGLQFDIFAPVIPTVLPFSILAASGNTGMYRGQFRAERFFHLSEEEQVTLTAGLSDANPTILNNDLLSEDNGLPNAEFRLAWSLGALQQVGLAAQRPFEVGVSSVLGQIRTTSGAPLTQVEADVWGVAGDWRWRINEQWGIAGEVFSGEGLGTYAGGILQNTNTATFESFHATGGWAEVYYYLSPCLHTHWGYGVDDPVDSELALGQPSYNETLFANLIWDVSRSIRFAVEVTARETEYIVLPGNDGVGVHGQMQWKF